MAIVSKDELLKQIKEALGEEISSDKGISIIENLTDTIDSLGDTDKITELNKTIAGLEEKVKSTEDAWRTKYTERFYSGGEVKDRIDDPSLNPPPSEEEDNKPHSFEDLISFDK